MDLPYRAKHGASYVKNQPWTIILTETQTFVKYEIVNLPTLYYGKDRVKPHHKLKI